MAGKILTPVTLWEDFRILSTDFKVIKSVTEGNITVTELYVYRPASRTERVAIYVKLVHEGAFSSKPAILLLQDVKDEISEQDLKFIVSKGYSAVSMDFAGNNGKKIKVVGGKEITTSSESNVLSDAIVDTMVKMFSNEKEKGKNSASEEFEYSPFTVYPEALSYAEYKNTNGNILGIGRLANQTPYYQWGVNARYVINYLRSVEKISKLGIVAVKNSATIGFHLASTEKPDALVTLYGSGWQLPMGYKYSSSVKTDFGGDEHKILAGIEAQSYASYVTCPTLMLVATNYTGGDIDRAYDTYSRIKPEVYSAINYTVGSGAYLAHSSYIDTEQFLKRFLRGIAVDLPKETEIDLQLKDGKFDITVTADHLNLEEIEIYASEGVIEPQFRCWRRVKDFKSTDKSDGKYTFSYSPVSEAGIVMFFAKSQYKNGFKVSSQIAVKKYSTLDVLCLPQYNVIYSSREETKNGIFEALTTEVPTAFNMKSANETLKEVRGPSGILGLPARRGLLTFNVLKPYDDAMLMLDICSTEDTEVKIELITDMYTTMQNSYVYVVRAVGGNIWNKVQIEMKKFKTVEGFQLKSYKNVKALKITGEGNFAVNNVLWI